MHFKDIEINNFRGFDHIKIEDFGQINLFVGKNNSGKTSVLESIFLLAGCNAILGFRINKFRDNQVEESTIEQTAKSIFYNLNENQLPEIKTKFNEKGKYNKHEVVERKLEIKPHYKTHFNTKELLSSNANNKIIDGLTFTGKLENGKTFENHFPSNSNGNQINNAIILPINFIHTRNSTELSSVDNGDLEELFKKRQEKKVVEFLNKIDDKIQGFQFIGNKLYFDLKDVEERVPISIVGDGVRKILTYLSSIFGGQRDKIILIDEIENGLHYTAHKTLWKGIIEACRFNNAQIFVTTHSLESLKYLNEVLQENGYIDFQEKVRCYDLVKTKLKGFQAYKYSYEGFSHALEMETEIR